jgi:hypothetical protein
MTAIIESWVLALCAAVAAVGYGSGLARFLQIRPNLGDRGILGLLGFGFLGCILHFVVALSTPVQIVVLAGGMVTAAVLRRDIRSDASLTLAGAAGLCLFLLLHPQTYQNPDDGLYYLQTFLWNREFPITAGLGNLHGRLAFNSILFLIAPLADRIEIGWIANLLAVTFVMLSLWARLRRIDLSDPRGSVQYWFVALVVSIFVLRPSWLALFGVLRADSVAAVLIAYWVALALGFSQSDDRHTIFALLVISAVLAATIKISVAPLLILTIALGWVHRKEEVVRAARVCALSAAVLAVWMLRGVLLSGCAIYPMRQTCFSGLPWAVSLQQVDYETMFTRSYGRGAPDDASVLRDWSWLPQWFGEVRHNELMELLLVGFVLGAAAVAFTGVKVQMRSRDDRALIAAGLAACLGFWFWSAPNVRFGMGFILAAALFGLSLAGAAWLHHPRFYSYTPQVLILLMALLGLRGLMLPRRVENFIPAIPEATVYQVRTPQSTRLWVPRNGDQCWAHELPCTPYVYSAVLARVHWPAPWPYRYDPQLEPPQGWTIPRLAFMNLAPATSDGPVRRQEDKLGGRPEGVVVRH